MVKIKLTKKEAIKNTKLFLVHKLVSLKSLGVSFGISIIVGICQFTILMALFC